MNAPREGVTLLGPVPPGTTVTRDGSLWGAIPEGMTTPRVTVTPDSVRAWPPGVLAQKPEYPKAARGAKLEGRVRVMARVLDDGSVGDAQVILPLSSLDSAAVATVKQMRFAPATSRQGGDVWVEIPVEYKLH